MSLVYSRGFPISTNLATPLALGSPCLCLLYTGIMGGPPCPLDFYVGSWTHTLILTLTLLTEPSSSLIQKGSLLLFLAFFPQALDTHLHIWMLTPAW